MDIYNMTNKLGFSAEYVDKISPAERGVYIRYYLKEQEEKAKQKTNHGPQIGTPVEG